MKELEAKYADLAKLVKACVQVRKCFSFSADVNV